MPATSKLELSDQIDNEPNQTFRDETLRNLTKPREPPKKGFWCANVTCPYESDGNCTIITTWWTCRRHQEP